MEGEGAAKVAGLRRTDLRAPSSIAIEEKAKQDYDVTMHVISIAFSPSTHTNWVTVQVAGRLTS
jgi:hypothetical protein